MSEPANNSAKRNPKSTPKKIKILAKYTTQAPLYEKTPPEKTIYKVQTQENKTIFLTHDQLLNSSPELLLKHYENTIEHLLTNKTYKIDHEEKELEPTAPQGSIIDSDASWNVENNHHRMNQHVYFELRRKEEVIREELTGIHANNKWE